MFSEVDNEFFGTVNSGVIDDYLKSLVDLRKRDDVFLASKIKKLRAELNELRDENKTLRLDMLALKNEKLQSKGSVISADFSFFSDFATAVVDAADINVEADIAVAVDAVVALISISAAVAAIDVVTDSEPASVGVAIDFAVEAAADADAAVVELMCKRG